jgi:hypothetical protein
MGFLNPGKPKRKRQADERPSKRQRSTSSTPSTQNTTKESTPVTQELEQPDERSILERLPTEVLQEIFIFTGVSALPFTCKSILIALTPSLSLKMRMLQNFIFDLNSEITNEDYKVRYALDICALQYRFISSEILKAVRFDTVLPLVSIRAESKNRLILHYDKLNKKLLEALYDMNASPEEINRELTRMTEERINMDDVDLQDLPEEEFQDYPERYYHKFKEHDIQVVEQLYGRKMRFKDGDLAISNAIRAGCDLGALSRVLKLTETGKISTVKPLISAFQRDNLDLVDWLLERQDVNADLINSDDLWIWISKVKRDEFLKFLTDKGANPSHGIIGVISNL